jgi:transmembrane protein EpsG
MKTVIILNILVIILAYFSKYRNTRFLFEIAFFTIFLFTALRFDFGRDYLGYYESFNIISNYSDISLIDYNLFRFEPGWATLNYIFKPIGFFGFIIMLSAFLCYTYYSLIKKYVAPQYYWMAVFIYVFSADIMWIQFSAIRQALSVAIFIHSVKYLNEKRNPVIFIIMNLVGGIFHTSAYFMIPFVIFSFEWINKNILPGLIIVAAFWGVLFFGDMYLSQMMEWTSFISKDRYTSTFGREVDISTTLIGSIAWGTILVIPIYYSRYQPENRKNLFYLTSLHSFVYVLTPLVWLSGRMGYFFAVFSIVVYPLIMQHEKNKSVKIGIFSIFAVFLLYRLKNFFELEWVIEGYSKYQTIFSEIFYMLRSF